MNILDILAIGAGLIALGFIGWFLLNAFAVFFIRHTETEEK